MIELVDTLPDTNVQPAEFKRLLGFPRERVLEDRPRALSRADIQARSGNRVGGGGAVEVHVHHLRKKLGEGVIETVRGTGYRITPLPGLRQTS